MVAGLSANGERIVKHCGHTKQMDSLDQERRLLKEKRGYIHAKPIRLNRVFAHQYYSESHGFFALSREIATSD